MQIPAILDKKRKSYDRRSTSERHSLSMMNIKITGMTKVLGKMSMVIFEPWNFFDFYYNEDLDYFYEDDFDYDDYYYYEEEDDYEDDYDFIYDDEFDDEYEYDAENYGEDDYSSEDELDGDHDIGDYDEDVSDDE